MGGTILETEAGESKCFPCSMDSLMNNLSKYPSSKTIINPARTKTGYLRPVTCPRKVNAFQYAYTTINTAPPNLTFLNPQTRCGKVIPETLNGIETDAGDSGRDSYKRHRFPVCLARLPNNDIIPPSLMLGILIRIRGKRADILAPPVMFDMVMLGRKQSLRNGHIVMMRRAHAAVESLLSAPWPSLYCKERIIT